MNFTECRRIYIYVEEKGLRLYLLLFLLKTLYLESSVQTGELNSQIRRIERKPILNILLLWWNVLWLLCGENIDLLNKIELYVILNNAGKQLFYMFANDKNCGDICEGVLLSQLKLCLLYNATNLSPILIQTVIISNDILVF